MDLISRTGAAITFPALPGGTVSGTAAGLGLRPFGTEESDLAVDFKGSPPVLITRILEQCAIDPGGELPPGFFRDLSVGKRLEFLLVLAASGNTSAFRFPFHCAGCREEIEFELTLDEIADLQGEADLIETVNVEIGGKVHSLRKPLGRDQEEWAVMTYNDDNTMAAAMIGRLAATLSGWEDLAETDLGLIDEKLDEADPLVNFFCSVSCGECGHANEFGIDLCEIALGMLARLQKSLIVTVHKLAMHYHWSEREIFAVPHGRRLEYLDLISAAR